MVDKITNEAESGISRIAFLAGLRETDRTTNTFLSNILVKILNYLLLGLVFGFTIITTLPAN